MDEVAAGSRASPTPTHVRPARLGAARGLRYPKRSMVGTSQRFVLVVGHRAQLDAEDGATALLRQLGAQVRTVEIWDEAGSALRDDAEARAIVIEAGERPDLAVAALRTVRREAQLEQTPAILAVVARQVANVEPSSGFDDFIVVPYPPAELYVRIRALEWKRSEFST